MKYNQLLESIRQSDQVLEAPDKMESNKRYLQSSFDNRSRCKPIWDKFCDVWVPDATQRMLARYQLWRIGADPSVDNVYLVTGLNLDTKAAEQWVFYLNDMDAEDTGDDIAQFASNLRHMGLGDLAKAFKEYLTPMEEGDADLDPTSIDNSTVLDEGRDFDWYILPATMALYGARTVDIYKAVSEWGKGTIYVCSKVENKAGGDKERTLFVFSSGQPYYKLGQEYHAGHDQTGASKGFYKVVNRVYFENNEIVSKDNDLGLTSKASLSVFK